MAKLKRYSINGSARINFSVEVNATSEEDATEIVDDLDIQGLLDNGVVTVDQLELDVPEVVVRQ